MTQKHPLNILFVSLIVLVALLLIGCQAEPDLVNAEDTGDIEFAVPAPEHTVNWMGHWLYEDKREVLVREVAAGFEFENPDVSVNLMFPQEILGIRSKPETAKQIAEMIRTGNYDWDIIWLDDNIYTYVSNELDDPDWGSKYLVNFEEVEGFSESQKPFIIDDPIYREQTGGMLVGPYIEGYYYALYYNADVAQQMGLEIKHEGMTYEDLLGYVQHVYEYNEENGTDIATFYDSGDWITMEILFQNLAKSEFGSFDEARNDTSSEEKLAALKKTLQAFEEMGQYDPLIESYAENVWFDTRNQPLEDQMLFYVGGTWMYNHWRGIDEAATSKMIPVELPAFNEVDYYLGGYIPTWAVFEDAPNRDQAIDLLMYWSTPSVAEKWVDYTKNPTGIAGNLASSTIGSDPFEEFQLYITEKYGANVHYTTNAAYLLGEENTLLYADLKTSLQQLLTGDTTADEVYEQIVGSME